MAAKVVLLSESKKQSVKVTRVVAEYLVRQLLAVQISKYLYQRLKVRPVDEVYSNPAPSEIYADKPSESPRSGNLRWEPPKSKRNFKGHPWSQIFIRPNKHHGPDQTLSFDPSLTLASE